ncbi:F-box/RNI/FBD-like domain protein [Rhynchospora pubera]|uniref:F-box/RNI/FBD-like domain protein n=1 Tax=Rhynchospora pubera TaxID=906938 RepID=A0AAV8F6B0_9POAL|nr:F-box/RNI/FBD-like domain protein [Rhynchospora pubera]
MAEAEVDRISFLPLDIKLEILFILDIKDAVRTSALARSWRHIWTHLSCLRLNSEQDPLGDTYNNPNFCNVHFVTPSWIQRVHRLVSSLRGPLSVFQLHFSGLCLFSPDESCVLVETLLDLLLQKGGLKTLDLLFRNDPGKFHLPWFHSLQVLRLSQCCVALPTRFQGFHRLETLSMKNVQISSDDFNLLLRTSNNLTSLIIYDCGALGNLLSVNLSLPLLSHLQFTINELVENLSVVSSPCLEHAEIKLIRRDYSSQNLARMILQLVTNVVMVSSLKLDFDVLKCFSLVALPFNFTIPRLRFLMFFLDVNIIDRNVYDAFFWLLRSMPFLEELEVRLESNDESPTNDEYDQDDRVEILMRELLVQKYDGFACLERTVTSVTTNMLTLGVIPNIAWIQFFLLNAKHLKLLKIGYFFGGHLMSSFIEELQKAEVTSSDAKVMFFNSHTHQITNVYE